MNKLLSTCLFCALALTASAQTAHFDHFTYTGSEARFQKTIDPKTEYMNPILAGFYPDPSLCRKGDTYYLVNSSFTFYPGVPLFTSKDLVNWTQQRYVLDRPSQLPLKRQNVSGGIFAPAISYNEKNKTFYMITTNVGAGNFYVKTKDPTKGWSEPIYLRKINGIDPSFFFDKDGKGYIVHNAPVMGKADYNGQRAIRLLRFDVKGDSTVGEPIEILRGGTHVEKHPIWIEGPHLFREGKYYYLMCAEGGTGAWHSEVILRARKPEGPWEECPHNPILTQRTGLDPQRPDIVTSTGHADIVKTPSGQWYAVFLGCRPYEADFYNTGRDTYLLPVTWKDGWPTILEKGKVVPTVVKKADLKPGTGSPCLTGNFTYTDRFDTGVLDTCRWMRLRNPSAFYTLPGTGIDITAKAAPIGEKHSPAAIFARQQHTDFTAETSVTFTPSSDKALAGMVLLQNEQYNFVFGKTLRGGKSAIVLTRSEKNTVTVGSAELSEADAAKAVDLKIVGHGRYYDFYYRPASAADWLLLVRGVDAVNLSTHYSGGFIGACIGLYATK